MGEIVAELLYQQGFRAGFAIGVVRGFWDAMIPTLILSGLILLAWWFRRK